MGIKLTMEFNVSKDEVQAWGKLCGGLCFQCVSNLKLDLGREGLAFNLFYLYKYRYMY